MDLPAVSEKDIKDLTFGVENGVSSFFFAFLKAYLGDFSKSLI